MREAPTEKDVRQLALCRNVMQFVLGWEPRRYAGCDVWFKGAVLVSARGLKPCADDALFVLDELAKEDCPAYQVHRCPETGAHVCVLSPMDGKYIATAGGRTFAEAVLRAALTFRAPEVLRAFDATLTDPV